MKPRKGQTWYRVSDGTPVYVRFVDVDIVHIKGVGSVTYCTSHMCVSTVALNWFLNNYRPEEGA